MRLLLLAAALLAASAAAAQPSNWELPTSGTTVGLTLDRPFFSEGNPFGTPLAGALTTTQPVGPVRIVGELPLAYVTAGGPFGTDEASAGLGNLQVGVEAGLPVLPVTLGGYVRVPTATSSGGGGAQFVGLLSSYEQPGAYVGDVVTVAALAEGRLPVGPVPGLALRLRVVPQVLIPTSDGGEGLVLNDPEAFAGYAAHVVFAPPLAPVRAGAGLSGLTLLTGDGEETTDLFAGAMVDARLGSLRPGLTVRFPLSDGLGDALDAVIGARLVVSFD